MADGQDDHVGAAPVAAADNCELVAGPPFTRDLGSVGADAIFADDADAALASQANLAHAAVSTRKPRKTLDESGVVAGAVDIGHFSGIPEPP